MDCGFRHVKNGLFLAAWRLPRLPSRWRREKKGRRQGSKVRFKFLVTGCHYIMGTELQADALAAMALFWTVSQEAKLEWTYVSSVLYGIMP